MMEQQPNSLALMNLMDTCGMKSGEVSASESPNGFCVTKVDCALRIFLLVSCGSTAVVADSHKRESLFIGYEVHI